MRALRGGATQRGPFLRRLNRGCPRPSCRWALPRPDPAPEKHTVDLRRPGIVMPRGWLRPEKPHFFVNSPITSARILPQFDFGGGAAAPAGFAVSVGITSSLVILYFPVVVAVISRGEPGTGHCLISSSAGIGTGKALAIHT